MKKTKENSGITLVSLVVTIIVLLILTGITISMLSQGDGIINKAVDAKTLTELGKLKEELELFKLDQKAKNENFYEESLTAGKNSLFYNTKTDDNEKNIKNVLTTISDKYIDNLEIIKGELLLNTQDKRLIRLAQSLNIKVNPYLIIEGRLMSSDGNLLLVDENGKLTIPENVTKIATGAFSNVEGLKTIIIPGTVKEIESSAFMNNNSLESVIILDGLEKINNNAFKYCTSLKKIEMPDSVTYMGSDVFWGDTKLEEVKLSEKLTGINGWTFQSCKSLKNIILPESITLIGKSAFAACTSLETINLPKNLNTILEKAFGNTTALNTINIDPENENFAIENGILYGKSQGNIVKILNQAVSGDTFTVPNGIKILDSNVLGDYTNITNVIIPDSVTQLSIDFLNNKITNVTISDSNTNYKSDGKGVYSKDGKELIRYYANESLVSLEEGLENIGTQAFSYNTKIVEINFPESLRKIQNSCFNGCSKLNEISLGKNITLLNSNSIYGSSINNIIIDENNENYSIINGALYNKDGTIFISPVKKLGSITSYSIPEGVKEIADSAFASQTKLSSITFPNTLEIIGLQSFHNCTSLTSVEIPSSIKKVGSSCFLDCGVNLTEIIIHKPQGSVAGSPWGCQYGDRAIKWDP